MISKQPRVQNQRLEEKLLAPGFYGGKVEERDVIDAGAVLVNDWDWTQCHDNRPEFRLKELHRGWKKCMDRLPGERGVWRGRQQNSDDIAYDVLPYH